MASPVITNYPSCGEIICKNKKLLKNENDEYYCNNITSKGKCSYTTKLPKLSNRLEINLVDINNPSTVQIQATAIGKLADALLQKLKHMKYLFLQSKLMLLILRYKFIIIII